LIITPPRPNNLFHLRPEDGRLHVLLVRWTLLGLFALDSSRPPALAQALVIGVRLRADIWVSAYLRRCAHEGTMAVLRRRGAPEAGAIFVKIDRLDGFAALYGPAPQSEVKEGYDRLFIRLHREPWIEAAEADAKLAREITFDPDLWIIETEDRRGRHYFDVAD